MIENTPVAFGLGEDVQAPMLLAPAGDWDCVQAAVENGADAVYFGLERFNARMRANNFTATDLPKVMAFLHQRGVKGFVTLNTLVFTQELADAEQYIRQIISAGVDAVIVQDIGICRLIRHLSPDFPIHGSTQMTVTSTNGVSFAHNLGCEVVVLARECSIKELTKIQQQMAQRSLSVALEVFVHGALCVAYSGQCLTSESLGGRSANRGECAQACRMTYDLVVDGKVKDLGDRHYLLSPQDLAGLDVLPNLIQAGVSCLKIEGRLKSPEYVASATQVYRAAIDKIVGQDAISSPQANVSSRDRYHLEMAFSRGLYTGWFEGINNQALVHGYYGKKRGVYLGTVLRVQQMQQLIKQQGRSPVPKAAKSRTSKRREQRSPQESLRGKTHRTIQIVVQLDPSDIPLKPGDGVMFDGGHPNGQEEGGRIYTIDYQGNQAILTFGQEAINPRRIHAGDSLWKTSDPALEKKIRQSFNRETPNFQRPIIITLRGKAGEMLEATAQDNLGTTVCVQSAMELVVAHTKPLTTERLHQQFSRLGNTPFSLVNLVNQISGDVMLPVSELNSLRRSLVEQLLERRSRPLQWTLHPSRSHADLLHRLTCDSQPSSQPSSAAATPILIPLLRNIPQLTAALNLGLETVYCEFEDPRRYQEGVQLVRQTAQTTGIERNIWVAPPRITKPLENWILDQVRRSQADGYLVRNYDHLVYFEQEPCIGDFSLNVANPLTAQYLWQQFGLKRLTASYDLNIQQLASLLSACPQNWFEVTLHQHMPMFHMEHCVFCAFLSNGTDFTNCGRPCEVYDVKLRDRTGAEHRLHADAGCRNTVYNSRAQTGVESLHRLVQAGLRHIRIEFLDESPEQVSQTITLYQQVLAGRMTGTELWQQLKLHNQLGVTRGQLDAN